MAVPKKKRYKQVVNHRRSLSKTMLLKKKYIELSYGCAFIKTSTGLKFYQQPCGFCSEKDSNHICVDCYTTYFKSAFSK
jgi:ribosomal protein L32